MERECKWQPVLPHEDRVAFRVEYDLDAVGNRRVDYLCTMHALDLLRHPPGRRFFQVTPCG